MIARLPADAPYATLVGYFERNEPFILVDATKDWPANEWVNRDKTDLNWPLFLSQYGEAMVCARGEEMPLKEVRFDEKTYIKDWHLALVASEPFYAVPNAFADDWMHNFYYNVRKEDFRFIYLGGGDTHTDWHEDVYGSYSWSANVLGIKRWCMVRKDAVGRGRYSCTDVDLESLKTRSGRVNEARWAEVKQAGQGIEVIQQPGEIIFVPSHWFHHVSNLSSATLSINQNWCNSYNIESIYHSLVDSHAATAASLVSSGIVEVLRKRSDLPSIEEKRREWNELIDHVTAINAGWNWQTFFEMITYNLKHPASTLPLCPQTSQVHQAIRNILTHYEKEAMSEGPGHGDGGAIAVAQASVETRQTIQSIRDLLNPGKRI